MNPGSWGRQASSSTTSGAWLRTERASFRLITRILLRPQRRARHRSFAQKVSPPPSQIRNQSKGGSISPSEDAKDFGNDS